MLVQGKALNALVKRAARGHEPSWQRLIGQWWPSIEYVGRRYFRDEERRHDLFLAVLERLASNDFRALRTFDACHGSKPSTGRAWVARIARNEANERLRDDFGERRRMPKAVDALAKARGGHVRTLFQRIYRGGEPEREAIADLRAQESALAPTLTEAQLEEDVLALGRALSANFSARLAEFRGRGAGDLPLDEVSTPADAPTAEEIELSGMRSLAAARLRSEMAALDEACRQVLTDYYFRGWSVQKIADERGDRSRFYANKRLQGCLETVEASLAAAGFDRVMLRDLFC